ncbi:hemerythrin domain-containing protein [Candidatus Nitrosocosmicus hydrocola]|uniref:hemerythrin domain-containing protein n=1 Tax=Candidatus Nitrosocosmicus hydrocola TaxID=1826872 RepID=UPI0011E5FD17|nr:hemerythrin domain-containing protein [Candidatus Nitrosocosmicus hydrocola]
MDYKINFNESIPQMISRLKEEHVEFRSTLNQVTKYSDENNINKAIETIHVMSESIIKHAVEEEARIMRVIMHNAKEESTDSIKIMQEHNGVVDFLKYTIPNIENNLYQQQNEQEKQYQHKVQKEINDFVTNLKNHFEEEEQIVFPLALKADLK